MEMRFRLVGRFVLSAILLVAGIGHFRSTAEFTAQVPTWMPAPDFVIYISGAVEIALAISLIALPKYRVTVGWIVAGFFVVIFPGNISQFITQTNAFGLDSDAARFIRLLFQPVLVIVALWSTGAWQKFRLSRKAST